MSTNKIYHLSTCNTCQRIIKELGEGHFELQDIKEEQIDEKTLDKLAEEHGSFESLFNKRARKYRSQGLHEKDLTEKDWKQLILGEYTFLKRPVVFIGNMSFVGNSKTTVAAAYKALQESL